MECLSANRKEPPNGVSICQLELPNRVSICQVEENT
jgi:hypothetical protein